MRYKSGEILIKSGEKNNESGEILIKSGEKNNESGEILRYLFT